MTARGILAFAVMIALGLGVIAVVTPLAPPPETQPGPMVQQWRRDGVYLAQVRGRGLQGTDGQLLADARAVCKLGNVPLEEQADLIANRHPEVPFKDVEFAASLAVQTQCPPESVKLS